MRVYWKGEPVKLYTDQQLAKVELSVKPGDPVFRLLSVLYARAMATLLRPKQKPR